MSVNLQIGFNNNFVTNSFYTKFLGVTMNNTLSWNNHIDLLVKKLSKACYIIRNAKTYIHTYINILFPNIPYTAVYPNGCRNSQHIVSVV
jgi:3-methyladenine DNA glycosylase AlkC